MSKKIQNSSSSNAAVLRAILNHDKTSANLVKLEEMKAERDEFRRRYEDECYENKVLTRKNDKLQIEVQNTGPRFWKSLTTANAPAKSTNL